MHTARRPIPFSLEGHAGVHAWQRSEDLLGSSAVLFRVVSNEHGCIFVHIPKCAGTSVEKDLGHFDLYSGPNRQDHRPLSLLQPVDIDDLTRPRRAVWAMTRQLKRRMERPENPRNKVFPSRQQWTGYYKFTIVRSPWGRLRSMYRNFLRGPDHPGLNGAPPPDDFNEFVANWAGRDLMAPMDFWLLDRAGRVPFDHIIEFENLANEWPVVARALGLSRQHLSHLNGSGSPPPQNYRFSDASISLVRRVYAWEFAYFGYSQDPDSDLFRASDGEGRAGGRSTLAAR